MSENEEPDSVLKDFEKANAAKEELAEVFRDSSLPVEKLSIVFSGAACVSGIAIAVDMTRPPEKKEMSQLPETCNDVQVLYYTVMNGRTVRLSW